MALPTSFKTLLNGGVVETARIEFKATWDPQASLKTICAFANDIDNWGGGYLVIGVTEDNTGIKHLTGIPKDRVDSYLKDMLNKCKLIQPSYMPITEIVHQDGKFFIMVWVPGGSNRPYSSPKAIGKTHNNERVFWIRKMASTITPTETEKRDLYNLANNVPFDDRINHSADISDLSLPLIKNYLKEVGSSLYQRADTMDFTELCRSMNIAEGPNEYVKPKNVGLLFFSLSPEHWFPYTRIDIVEMPDWEGGDTIVEHTFSGPVHQQLREALQYLKNTVIADKITKHSQSAEAERHYNYPYAALEEALSNAVYHKGYDSREPIEVRVLPNRIEVLSHPGADRSISLEGLRTFRAVSRRYRNRRVGEFLKELHLTEGRNTGFHKILRALRDNGSPDPVFETDEERSYFLTTIYAYQESAPAKTTQPLQHAANAREQGILNRRDTILQYLANHPHTTLAQLSHELGITRSTVDRDIFALKQSGQLQRVGSTVTGAWHVNR